MSTAIILHGKPSKESYYSSERDSQSNSHWLPWLQRELCIRDILAQTPEMPAPYNPSYEQWRQEFERQVVDESTILVGHSCGAGFLVRWLSESRQAVKKLVLVAPWLDPTQQHGGLFDFAIDTELEAKTGAGIDILHSIDDGEEMQATVSLLRKHLPAVRYHEFTNYGHFCFRDMNTREFPELLEICLADGDRDNLTKEGV